MDRRQQKGPFTDISGGAREDKDLAKRGSGKWKLSRGCPLMLYGTSPTTAADGRLNDPRQLCVPTELK